jgi:predicted  nucleic acid-binding Zn-ribbon protein
MSDLVKRLRKQSDPEHRLFDTAADEIERLQKRVSDADECIEEQEEMLEHLIVDQGQYEEEIERLQKAYRPADMIEYQELVAENERLRGEIIKLQFQGGTVDRQALENNVQRGKKIASLQADNELLSKLNQEYGAEIERLREAGTRCTTADITACGLRLSG